MPGTSSLEATTGTGVSGKCDYILEAWFFSKHPTDCADIGLLAKVFRVTRFGTCAHTWSTHKQFILLPGSMMEAAYVPGVICIARLCPVLSDYVSRASCCSLICRSINFNLGQLWRLFNLFWFRAKRIWRGEEAICSNTNKNIIQIFVIRPHTSNSITCTVLDL